MDIACFGKNKARSDGVQVYCRDCMKALRKDKQYDKIRWEKNRDFESARNRLYRQASSSRLKPHDRERSRKFSAKNPGLKRKHNIARKHGEKMATPLWANIEEINRIYRSAKSLEAIDGIERHVDHVIPLRHPLVCGLQVQNNLEILTALENMKKHNRFEVCDA